MNSIDYEVACKALEANDRKPLYGQSINWNGGYIQVDLCTSPEKARMSAIRFALDCGYTVPRWWQFWRYNDDNISKWPEYKQYLEERQK